MWLLSVYPFSSDSSRWILRKEIELGDHFGLLVQDDSLADAVCSPGHRWSSEDSTNENVIPLNFDFNRPVRFRTSRG